MTSNEKLLCLISQLESAVILTIAYLSIPVAHSQEFSSPRTHEEIAGLRESHCMWHVANRHLFGHHIHRKWMIIENEYLYASISIIVNII